MAVNYQDYAGTLLRYGCCALAIALAMVLLHRLLRYFRAGEQTAAGYAFILPWLIGIALFWVVPMIMSLYLSMTHYAALSSPKWVGLNNYVQIFTEDVILREAAWNTITFALFSVALGLVASLLTAVLLSMDIRLMGLWRSIYYLPSVVPAVSTALLWRWLFVPDGGLINTALLKLGVPERALPGWFSDPNWVIPAFIIMTLQGAAGNNMVIFLAKLKGIDAYLYEAAAIDGAGMWARFRHITLPQLSPVVFFQLVMSIIGSLQIFTQPMFVQTPGRSGLFYSIYIYRTGWQEWRMGYACALSWVMFAALVLLTALVFRSARYWVSYEQTDVLIGRSSRVLTPPQPLKSAWYTLVVMGALLMLVPITWMISTSLKSTVDLSTLPPRFFSLPLQWGNYVDAWLALPFTRFVLNTLLITALAVAGEIIMSTLVAYGFARFNFRGRKPLFALLLSTMLIPGMVMMIPVFLIWRKLGLIGTFDPLVLGSLLGGGALYVFIAHQFLKTLPRELEEAARLDGASPGRTFFSIIMPLIRPVLLVIALISFQAHWNDFLGPLIYLNDRDQYTMTMGLHFFQAKFMGEAPKWHWLMAMTTVMAVPTLLIFVLTQRTIFGQVDRPAPRPGT